MRFNFQWLLAVGCAAFWASPTLGGSRALLIGISDYSEESGLDDLQGPPNDVRLLRDVIRKRGISDIAVLADHVDGGARPTRAAILAAFANLADASSAGDFVYIHISGHGTQQADQNSDESDGLDEIILAADTKMADPATGLIVNAIVDDEIGAAVHAIRAKGANVWLVMDACHSGSGIRGDPPNVVRRFVKPELLGVTVRSTAPDSSASVEIPQLQGAGDFIAFYAARSDGLASEVEISKPGQPSLWYGLFSMKLAARLDSDAQYTFRQLFQAVQSDINGDAVPGAAQLQTPLWEGKLIDAPVFGGTSSGGPHRYGVDDGTLAAGLVHGLSDGTLVGLVADVAVGPDDVIGWAQLYETEAREARLRAVARGCVPRTNQLCDRLGVLPVAAKFAHVLARPVDLKVRIAVPLDLTTGVPLDKAHSALAALNDAIAMMPSGNTPPVELVTSDFQVDAVWDGRALWFGRRAVIGQTPVGLSWTPGSGDLSALLTRIARAEELARLIGSAVEAPDIMNENPVRIAATLEPVPALDPAQSNADNMPFIDYCKERARLGRLAEIGLTADARLKECDRLIFVGQGTSPGIRDVNRVYIDAQYCVSASYVRIADTEKATRLGSRLRLCSDCPDGFNAGDERIFVIVSKATTNQEPLSLKGQIETCPDPNGTLRTGNSRRLRGILDTLLTSRTSLGGERGLGNSDIWVEAYSWTVIPQAEVPTQLPDN